MRSVDITTFWNDVLGAVREDVSEGQFETWFSRASCQSLSDDEVVIGVPNTFYLEWLKRQYSDTLRTAVEKVLGEASPAFDFVIVEEEDVVAAAPPSPRKPAEDALEMAAVVEAPAPAAPAPTPPPTEHRLPRQPSSLQLNPDYTFDNFVVGPSNRLAHAAALAVVEDSGRIYNPLFVHGGLGLGKTHVLQAICHSLVQKRPKLRMLYIPCEQFINQFISALERNQVEAFRQSYRMLDVLLIDDIHFLANKDHTQEEFFHTFNALYNDHRQIILSSDSAPRDIPTLEERLVSRFKWGLVCEMEQPTYETRTAIIRKKARISGRDLSDDVIEFLAGSLKTSIREIEGAVTRLVGYASIMNQPITLETAKAALGGLVGAIKKRVTVDRIVALVTEHYGVRLSDLQSKKRFQSITLPRQVCMYLARQHTSHSLAEIGGYFGGRDHSTVLYATDKIEKRIKNDPELRAAVADFRRQLEM